MFFVISSLKAFIVKKTIFFPITRALFIVFLKKLISICDLYTRNKKRKSKKWLYLVRPSLILQLIIL